MKIFHLLPIALIAVACGDNKRTEEQIRFESPDGTEEPDTTNSVTGGLELSQISTYPQRVILNGMPQHRLVTIYKYIPPKSERDVYGKL